MGLLAEGVNWECELGALELDRANPPGFLALRCLEQNGILAKTAPSGPRRTYRACSLQKAPPLLRVA